MVTFGYMSLTRKTTAPDVPSSLSQPVQDLAEMAPDLRRHIRYPATLFSVQAELYLQYHITDPQVFFNQAEQWNIPLASAFGKDPVRLRLLI